MPTEEVFILELNRKFIEAEKQGHSFLQLTSGELHRSVGGYPGKNHRMPVCCNAMRKVMRLDDIVVNQPPKGKGASLEIRYKLPR
jgi:hypothetical protein